MADDVTPTEAEVAETNEWNSAIEEFAPGYAKEETTDAKTTTDTTTAETTTETTTAVETTTDTTTIDPNETPEQKAAREAIEAESTDDKSNSADKTDAKEEPKTDTRTARQVNREAAKEVETIAADVREKVFVKTQAVNGVDKQYVEGPDKAKYVIVDGKPSLADTDLDPIRSIEDVMKLLNPITGEGFTEEAAAQWLLSAQQKMNQNLANMDKQIDQIANVNVDMKDQADSINYQYGELLKEMPELRDQLWLEYSNTLVKDPTSGIVTGMPVSLERFYEIALQPYVKLAQSLEAQEQAKTEAEKAQADAKKTRTRADRSDIYGRGKIDDMDDEEKEWAKAGADYFGNK
jgi:hypothetical protein